MNLYFSSVYTHTKSNLPEFDNIINARLNSILYATRQVEKYLKTLNAHKSPGPYLIPPRILKECAHELSTPLCAFFNQSFTPGLLPTEWKMANITPIHKKGHKHKKENYRQISCSIPLQTGILFDVPVCSSLAIYIVLHTSPVVFGLNGLVFNEYFEYCRSKNTRANHPYKLQTKLAKVKAPKYSFFVRIIKDWKVYQTTSLLIK